MARINIEGLLKHIDFEIKRAIGQSLRKTMPDTQVDSKKVANEFLKALCFECQAWHKIPDSLVDSD